MRKKLLLGLVLLVFTFGCVSLPTFEEIIEDFVEESDTLVKVEEILDFKEYDDAIIGLALIMDEEEEDIIYLGGSIVDERTGFSLTSHGLIEPLYIHDEKEIIINPSKDKKYESDPKNNYFELRTDEIKYYTGIVEGGQKLKYGEKNIYTKRIDFEYRGNSETITFWIVKLSSNEDFSIDQLTQ